MSSNNSISTRPLKSYSHFSLNIWGLYSVLYKRFTGCNYAICFWYSWVCTLHLTIATKTYSGNLIFHTHLGIRFSFVDTTPFSKNQGNTLFDGTLPCLIQLNSGNIKQSITYVSELHSVRKINLPPFN